MKHRLCLGFFLLVFAGSVCAQTMSVKSFRLLPNDMTAASLEGKRIDQNGEAAALIRVVTSQTGFGFEAGTLGIVATKQMVGEVWVWVPHGSRKISIMHQQLGVLRDYRYPIEIEAERTYELVLVSGKVETFIQEEVHQQYLVFQITPPNASLEVNDQFWELDADGTVMKYVEFGEYRYRVQASNYHTDAGKIVVNDRENTQIVSVVLQPNFGWLEVGGTNNLTGASVYIDNDFMGKAPCKSPALKSGQYTVRIVKEMYVTYSETVTIKDNETTKLSPLLQSDYAEVTLKVDSNAEIWVNNEKKGVGSWTGKLGRGVYKIECKLAGYESSQTSKEITADMNGQVITLQPPRALYGSLNVESTPNLCTLYIDGKSMGTTPKSLPEVLVGQHEILLAKEGYDDYRETVTLQKGEKKQLKAVLQKKQAAQPDGGVISTGEGLWIPMLVERLNYTDMQKQGLQLSASELYSDNNSSIKDAVVGLGNGEKPRAFTCTGEMVSENGLLLTCYHCGYNDIQKLSSEQHDYLRDGFWAKNHSEEIPVPGMSASFLIRMEEVTSKVLGVVNDRMSWKDRDKAIKQKINELESAASENGKYNPVIKPFYEGNEYYLCVYQVFPDVRLVGAPNSSIGKFGGSTDNWMWPRHTGDFAIFRVYADRNGKPAAYSPNNVPMTPKHHLPISLGGVEKGDFTMVWGFPGSTERYMSSYGIDYDLNTCSPIIIDIFGKEVEVMKEYMETDRQIYLKYAYDYGSLSNTWKVMGQRVMFQNNGLMDTKKALENNFTQWVNANSGRKAKYGTALPSLKTAYQRQGQVAKKLFYSNFVSRSGPSGLASSFGNYYNAASNNDKNAEDAAVKKLEALDVDGLFAETDPRVEKKLFAELLKVYRKAIPSNELPEIFSVIDKKFKGDIDAFADEVYDNSIFATPESIKAFIARPNAKKLGKDYAYQVYSQMMDVVMGAVSEYRQAQQAIQEYDHLFVKGLMEYYHDTQPKKLLYSDANSTMRVNYGSVQDYYYDNKHFEYYANAQGVLDKYKKNDFEFDAPARLIQLLESKSFGRYANRYGDLMVSFISANDITGGSSGAPVVNAKGELVGITMDGNKEAMSGTFCFNPASQRAINVDIRYVLFIIDKFAGAANIINELDIQ